MAEAASGPAGPPAGGDQDGDIEERGNSEHGTIRDPPSTLPPTIPELETPAPGPAEPNGTPQGEANISPTLAESTQVEPTEPSATPNGE